jgi:hypothetical protein
MMLAAAVPGLATPILCQLIAGETLPLAVVVVPAVWIALFVLGRFNTLYALWAGVVWGVLNVVAPLGLAVRGIRNALAELMGLPVCPFALVGSLLALLVVYFAVRGLRELPATA